jgi:ferredoxin-type protein NapH
MNLIQADKINLAAFKTPAIITGVFWIVAVVLWRMTGRIFYLFNFGYIGAAVGLGIGLYAALPKRQKHWGRKLAQLLVGLYMLVFLGLLQRENMQIEGFWFYLLFGFFAGSVIHYMVAKVAGPLVFNRGWCGWACWTAMVLDFLPYRRPAAQRNKRGRLDKWGHLRYVHLALSLGLVLALWFGWGYRVQDQSVTELYWLLGGNVLYYAISIGLAFALRDNRAFCKYVCSIPVLQKLPSRFGLLKVVGDATKCTDCGACVKSCPMDIRITDYIQQGRRVLSTECIVCFECVNVCTKGALDMSFGLDMGKLDERLTVR